MWPKAPRKKGRVPRLWPRKIGRVPRLWEMERPPRQYARAHTSPRCYPLHPSPSGLRAPSGRDSAGDHARGHPSCSRAPQTRLPPSRGAPRTPTTRATPRAPFVCAPASTRPARAPPASTLGASATERESDSESARGHALSPRAPTQRAHALRDREPPRREKPPRAPLGLSACEHHPARALPASTLCAPAAEQDLRYCIERSKGCYVYRLLGYSNGLIWVTGPPGPLGGVINP